MDEPVWFWQRIVSPHVAGLAEALAASGRPVTYVAERLISEDRAAQGWQTPRLSGARLELAPDAASVERLVATAPRDSIHICQGLRGNGLVGHARKRLARRTLRQWAILETVDDAGWRGALKRMLYRALVTAQRRRIDGVLAIGHRTSSWVVARGMPESRVFPFAYFLSADGHVTKPDDRGKPFRFLFVGQLIELKRLDLLIDSLASPSLGDFELTVVGAGPLEEALRARACAKLGPRVSWLGRRQQHEIPNIMVGADCLVLPSRYDGWGAVISEALMQGTPVICSDGCGAAGVVQASGAGGVFSSGDVDGLIKLIREAVRDGRPDRQDRRRLASWAGRLGAPAGARYLSSIFDHVHGIAERPKSPWEVADVPHTAGPIPE